jgi:hypothetical protein
MNGNPGEALTDKLNEAVGNIETAVGGASEALGSVPESLEHGLAQVDAIVPGESNGENS